jgi:hypothetical protein
MKVAFNESLHWESSKQGVSPEVWKVLPVNFATDHKNMLSHLHMLINKEYLAVPEEHEKINFHLDNCSSTTVPRKESVKNHKESSHNQK